MKDISLGGGYRGSQFDEVHLVSGVRSQESEDDGCTSLI
jgi:hypothetical protein